MLFFDLEFYVPRKDRDLGQYSFKYNPNVKSHKLLGGTFYSKSLTNKIPTNPKFIQKWLWNHNNDERFLLESIYKLFKDEWTQTIKEDKQVLGKPINHPVICGIGVSWADMPILYCRSINYKIATPEELYNVYFKTKFVELSNVCSLLFPEELILYPKTTREINTKLKNGFFKDKSKNVWDLFDDNKTADIENRTTQELKNILLIYDELQNDILSKRLQQFNTFRIEGINNPKKKALTGLS